MAIERVFTNRNLHSAVSVSRASGNGSPGRRPGRNPRSIEYTPTAVKLAVTGDGAADKRMVGDMVETPAQVGVPHPDRRTPPMPLAVALCHLQSMRLVTGGHAR